MVRGGGESCGETVGAFVVASFVKDIFELETVTFICTLKYVVSLLSLVFVFYGVFR